MQISHFKLAPADQVLRPLAIPYGYWPFRASFLFRLCAPCLFAASRLIALRAPYRLSCWIQLSRSVSLCLVLSRYNGEGRLNVPAP